MVRGMIKGRIMQGYSQGQDRSETTIMHRSRVKLGVG